MVGRRLLGKGSCENGMACEVGGGFVKRLGTGRFGLFFWFSGIREIVVHAYKGEELYRILFYN